MRRTPWLASVQGLFERRKSHAEAARRSRASRNGHLERLEERRVMAFDLVAAYAESDTPFFLKDATPASATLGQSPQQITLRFTPGTQIDPATLGSISVQRVGGTTITPGSVTVDDVPNGNQVVIRFAETLTDGIYRVVIGDGLKSGADSVRRTSLDIRLDIGAYVVSIVPQPITGSGNALAQARNTVHVFFNAEDPLRVAAAQNTSFYRLVEVGADGNDVVGLPLSPANVAYDATSGRAVLTFAADLPNDKLFRLEVGGGAAAAAPGPVAEASDTNSSFGTAQNLGVLSTGGQVVTGAISVRPTLPTPLGNLGFPTQPGSIDEPGHRDTPADSGEHGAPAVAGVRRANGIEVRYYNFKSEYGFDPQDNQLYNAITETQKQRAREIFELYSRYAGVRFVESADQGITVVTGDMRALDPTITTAPAGIASSGMAIMDATENWGESEYGGAWFGVAMHEIGHAIGLAHTYDLPSIMGRGLSGEPVFPGDYDIVHLRQLYAADGSDIDLYSFTLPEDGRLTAETVIARPGQPALSLLDSVLTLYRQDPATGRRELIARNDDSFGRDSFLGLDLPAKNAAGGDYTYFIAVTSTGNTAFNPEVADSGSGGRTDGRYELRLGFAAKPKDIAAATIATTIVDATGRPFDGDRDGVAGGVHRFWFQTADATKTVYVDKTAAAAGADGTLAKPYASLQTALSVVRNANTAAPGSKTIVRIVGSAATPYLIGTDAANRPLSDGASFTVPAGVTVMIDAGAVFKLRSAIIDVGSSSPAVSRAGAALQVLGTPTSKVTFTSYHDDTIGGDSDRFLTATQGGQWGGIVFRGDSDAASKKAFINTVSQADMRFGGGEVTVDARRERFAPIQVENTRPTLTFNTIIGSSQAAIAATPNSFEESNGRVGPELRGNRLVGNSVNGLFVKIDTGLRLPIQKLDVPARFRSSDIVYVLQENLLIAGGAGGYERVGGNNVARTSGRLTIDPGVVVKLDDVRIELELGTSQLIAEGHAHDRVIFTSLGDNRFGAGGTFDTNGNQPDGAAAGDWGGIVLRPGAKASIDQAYIGFGGGQASTDGIFETFSVVEVHQGDLRLANSRIENNAAGGEGAAVAIRGAQPVIVGNDFRFNRGAVVSINANSLTDVPLPDPGRSSGFIDRFAAYDANRGPLVRGNRLPLDPGAGAIAGLQVRGEEITVESVWDDTDIVHVLEDEIIVENFHTATGLRLQSTADASLVVKLAGANAGFTAAGYALDIDDRIGGTVQIIGQPGRPVILTSLEDDTVGAGLDPLGRSVFDTNGDGASTGTAGDWRSLAFRQFSSDRNVAVYVEAEAGVTGGLDRNGLPEAAQYLGVLAPNYAIGANTWESSQEKTGDENRRLGFEVHGAIAADDTTDVDVYAFTGYAGSEVWIDVDKTAGALDAMVELVAGDGTVLARSADSQSDGDLSSVTLGGALPLMKDAWRGDDYYTLNPRDPGMRVILPGTQGQVGQYFVRVRSQPKQDAATLAVFDGVDDTAKYEASLRSSTFGEDGDPSEGATSGSYELRVRLRQRDEKPGSTVRHADIRFATTAIDVEGLPRNSLLVGETGEDSSPNDTFDDAQILGNLLQSDRNTLSVAGTIDGEGDVDWYSFALNYEQIQSIGGVNNGLQTWATVFDIDYADGFRGDLTISVFDETGKLIFVGRDSDIEDDQPATGQGTDFDDLSRGSIGKLDPFIGSVQLPAGMPTGGGGGEAGGPVVEPDPSKQLRYYVAISSNERLPEVLNATFRSDAANAQIRLEPINSLYRIVEDHIGSIGYEDSAEQQINPTTSTPLIETDSAINLAAHVTSFTLADVTLFLSTSGGLYTHDAVSGKLETTVNATAYAGLTIGDIDIRPDGKLYAYAGLNGSPTTVGQLMELNSGTGAAIAISPDAIPNAAAGNPSNFQTTSDTVTAMAFGRTNPGEYRDLWLLVQSGSQSKLYLAADGGSATAAADATANQGPDSEFGYWGRIGIDFNGDRDYSDQGERPLVTGLQFVNDASGILYGVTSDGKLLTIRRGTRPGDGAEDFDAPAVVVADYGPDLAKVGATGFTALATAPQNLYDGALRGKFFALTNDGRLVLINPTATTDKAATLTGTAGLLQRTGDTGGSIYLTGATSGVVSTKATTSGAVALSGTTSGTTFTASGTLPNTIRPDMLVTGPGVPYNTTVSSLVGGVVTLSQAVSVATTTDDIFFFIQPLSPQRAVTAIVNPVGDASATVEVDNATDIEVGMLVINERLPANTIVTAVDLARGDVTLTNSYSFLVPGSPRMLFVRPDRTQLGTLSVGSNAITGITTGNLRIGMAVFGDGVPNGARVTNVLGTRIELSVPATADGQKTLYFVDGRSVFGIVNTDQIRPGMVVEAGPNIAPNTFVTAVNATGIVLSQGAIGTASLADLRFFQPVVANVSGTAAGASITIDTTSLEVGMVAVGPGVPANTTILAIGSGDLTLSNAPPPGAVTLTFYRNNDGTPVVLATPTNLSTAGITTGMLVFGAGIASNTRVAGLNTGARTLSLSKPALETINLNELRLVAPATSRVAAITAGQAVVRVPTTAGIAVDMVAVADGVADGALVTAVDPVAGSITLSQPVTQTLANVTVRFIRPDIVRDGTGDPFDPSSTTLTISTANLHVGMLVFGNGIPTGTIITAKSADAVTLSNAIVPGAGRFAFVRDGRVVSSLSGMNNIGVGQTVTGAAIPAGVTVAGINPADREITLSQSVTAATLSNTLTFTLSGISNAIIGNLPSTANLSVGMTVIGNGIPAGTTITSIDDSKSITLSAKATTAGARYLIFVTADRLASPAVTRDGATTSGSAVVSLANVADLRVGMLVQGSTLSRNSLIVSRDVGANTITLSAAATADGTESLRFISTSSLDYLGDWSGDYNASPVLAAGATGIAFSPLDINLWHTTERRGDGDRDSVGTPDPGHGVNAAPDNSRASTIGGTSMYFGLETWKESETAYQIYTDELGQYGVTAPEWQRELTTNTGRGDTYDLPGGAYGSLTTNPFSLAGYIYTNKPTLYFNYWLDTEDASGTGNAMRDSARVLISKDGGATWEVIASNKETDLPGFPSVSSKISEDSLQHVQELFDSSETTGWRQARIDLGKYAGEADLRLRFDFHTAGEFDPTVPDPSGEILGPAGTAGNFTSPERGQRNNFEGFYIDDIIVGFAERGEMVTGAVENQTSFFDVATPVNEFASPQVLEGAYQLEIRRGTEYAIAAGGIESSTSIDRQFDTNDRMIAADGLLGDANLPREQGVFVIDSNIISNSAENGIAIDAAARDSLGTPSPGVPLNFHSANGSRLVPGAVVVNNIVSTSGQAGILFSGDAFSGDGPLAAVPLGTIINNTIYGGATAGGIGIQVTHNAAPTILNNVFANLATGVQVDGSSAASTVVGRSAYSNTATQVTGSAQSQAVVLSGTPFVNAAGGNFYLRAGEPAIDSAIDALQDRSEFIAVTSALAIPPSPILAPATDVYGQLRGDDPTQGSQPGLGGNAFKDRGAVERSDVDRPFAMLVSPEDQSVADLDPAYDSVILLDSPITGFRRFEIQLADMGVGIDAATVVAEAFTVTRNGVVLVAGTDYLFRYVEGTQRVVFEAAAVFPLGAYAVRIDSRAAGTGVTGRVTDRANNPLLPNASEGVGPTAVEYTELRLLITESATPGAPTAVVGTPGEDNVSISWTAPASTGITPLTDYAIQYSSDGGTTWTDYVDAVSTSTTAIVTPLVPGTGYVFRVAARNSYGLGDYSAPSAVITPQQLPPGAPTNVTGTRGNRQVVVTWTAPSFAGTQPITDYHVEYSSDDGANWTRFADGLGTDTTATVTGLTNGTAYLFQIRAVNSRGESAWAQSAASVTPLAAASSPTGVVGTRGDRQVALVWTAPADTGGSAITDYVVQYRTDVVGSSWQTFNDGTSAGTTATVTGLTNGTSYVFRVTAVTGFGQGAPSAESAAVMPLAAASAPTSVVGTRGDRQVSLTWAVPSSNGGSAISDYVVEYRTDVVGSSWQTFADGTSTGTSATVTGLTNGTAYRFRVTAVTSFGLGASSSESAAVTPLAAASSPTGVVGTRGDRQVALVWTAPADNGGSAITDYVVQYRTHATLQSWQPFADGVSAATQAVVTGLENGISYRFRVAAVTAAGESTNWTVLANVTPATVPGAPTGLLVEPSDGSVAVSWAAPSSGGSVITDYVVQYRTNVAGSPWQTFSDGVSTGTVATVTGLTNATAYVFRVIAVNAMGQGQPSAESPVATPGPQAQAPTRLSGRAGDSSVALVWTAPTVVRGQQIVDYAIDFRLITGDVAGAWQRANDGVSSATQATVTGLQNGATYEFRVAAVTTPGGIVGVFSDASARHTPQALPPAPASLTAKKQTSTSVALSWTTPATARSAGPAITGYVIQYRETTSGRWVTREIKGPVSSSVISKLSSRKSYVFRVAARSAAGLGAFTSEVRA